MAVACALAGAACGDDQEPARRTAPLPVPTATDTPSPTTTPTATPTATPSAAATPAPEGGDEGGNRTEVALTLAAEDVVPARVEVPAFLGLRLRVTNESGAERILRIDGRVILEILPGQDEEIPLEGLQPGEHVLEAGESGRAVLVAERAQAR